MPEHKHTKGKVKVRFMNPEDEESDFFLEALRHEGSKIGYGIDIMSDDYGEHNGYPREQRLADANLIAEAFNVTNETGKTPRELQEENESAVELLAEAKLQIEYLHSKFKKTGSGNAVLSAIDSFLASAQTNNKTGK